MRRGERDAFVRYYEAYRASVYGFVRLLLRAEDDAVSATQETFTAVYRRILLHGGAIDLPAWTFAAALDACHERLSTPDAVGGAAGGIAVAVDKAGRREADQLGRRFAQALEALPTRHQAALVLHDVVALRPAEAAAVFDLTEEATDVLLFRAREEFRRAFHELSSQRRVATCRLAEQMAAGAVGRGLSEDEARRLHEHAGYCRECRRTMKGWPAGAVGLALLAAEVPLPWALQKPPVFGRAGSLAVAPAAGAGAMARLFAPFKRAFSSRAIGYGLAAVFLALSVGLAVRAPRVELMTPKSSGPSVHLLVPPAVGDIQPSASSSGSHAVATATRLASRTPLAATGAPSAGSPAAPRSRAVAARNAVAATRGAAGSAASPGGSGRGHPAVAASDGRRAVSGSGDATAAGSGTARGAASAGGDRRSGGSSQPARAQRRHSAQHSHHARHVGRSAQHHAGHGADRRAARHAAHSHSGHGHGRGHAVGGHGHGRKDG